MIREYESNKDKEEFDLQMGKLADQASAIANTVKDYFKPPNAMRVTGLASGWDVIVCRKGASDRIWGELDPVEDLG